MLDIAKELEKTLHIHSGELPFVDTGYGTETRLILARPKDRLYALQYRAQPGARSPLHKHQNAILGYTLKGRWGHDEQYLYRPGTFIFETPGVVHQFMNGPEVSEALFIGDMILDFVDPETLEVTGGLDGPAMLDGYIKKCKEKGLSPRFIQ
jgi:2,4'-dihydroxyacetophenone dioxygenase